MNKEEKYALLWEDVVAYTSHETDRTAVLANVAALIHAHFRFWWTGFYLVASDDELVLGPFQGPAACYRIRYGKGVCGSAWKERTTLVVPDVEAFPGHIACSAASRSEIVVPLVAKGVVVGVLDIDSEHLSTFDATDARHLERIAALLVEKLY